MEQKQMNSDEDFDDEDTDTQKERYLTFRLGAEDFGIEIAHVTEIVGLQHITSVPDLPSFVKGVINLRGNVIPVIDVRMRFHMEPIPYNERTCVIVVSLDGKGVGLLVDTVNEVLTIPENQVSPPPEVGGNVSRQYVRGLGKVGTEVKVLLDIQKLFDDEEIAKL